MNSCKLLSKLYLCNTEYSDKAGDKVFKPVVNCFQNCIFVILNTVDSNIIKDYEGCKLLSKLYLCNTEYSSFSGSDSMEIVVNCFQNCIFVILNTVPPWSRRRPGAL